MAGQQRFGSRYQSRFKPRYQSKFEIVTSDYTSSIDEWQRAQRATKEELPALSEEQKHFATKLGLSEEAYARSVLAGRYGANRMHERATALGELVQSIAAKISARWKVQAVIAEMFKGRWVIRMESPAGSAAVAVPRELADDILDSGLTSEVKRLKGLVADALSESQR